MTSYVQSQQMEILLHELEECLPTSMRKIAANRNNSQSTMFMLLKNQFLSPHYIQLIQALLPGGFLQAQVFCRWMQTRIQEKSNLVVEIPFSRAVIVNSPNNHI